MKASDLLVRCLEEEGVRYIFGVPGEENEDLLFSLADSSIEFVPTRHEQGAAFIADVWGRLTGRAGVCLSTLGPGATNLLTGVADAHLDKSPLVALTAQGSTTRLHHESHQLIDVVALFEPVTKWNTAIAAPEVIPEVVRKAFKLAEAEKPGATHIELSEDLAASELAAPLGPMPPRAVRRPAPDAQALDEALERLRHAHRPLILAGNGAIRKRASRDLTALVDRHGIPVASTFMGKGAVSDRNPLSLHSIGLGFDDYGLEAFHRADLVLAVGYDIAEYAPEQWNPDGDQRILHLDFEPAEVYRHYDPEVELVGDVSASLQALDQRLEVIDTSFEDGWAADVRQRIVDDLEDYRLSEGQSFHVPGVLQLIRKALPDEGLLISDVGTHKMWIARNFPTYCPNGCIVSNGLASMGIALPGAIAASLVDPARPVIAAMGDGGFLMNAQELETARRLGARFVCLVFRDDDYGLIRWKQQRSRNASTSTRIDNPDLVTLAESFGIPGYRPKTAKALENQLRKAFETRELCLIDVPITTEVNQQLIRKLEDFWGAQKND